MTGVRLAAFDALLDADSVGRIVDDRRAPHVSARCRPARSA
jgi:hypothetical protein